MLCLKGYVIPRRDKQATHYAAAQSGQSRTMCGSKGTDNCLSKRLRCKFCKNFHDPNKYCFRLRTGKKVMSNRRKRSRRDREETDTSSTESSDSADDRQSSSEHSVGKSGGDSGDDQLQVDGEKAAEDSFGPPFGSLEDFYDNKKRIDAYDVKLILRPETIKMYFEKLLADGKMDYESAKKLHKKYFMADKDYAKIAPPSLSSTKLHEIQSHDLGGVHNRLMGIHISMRSTLKIVLRSYESLGGVSSTFTAYTPANVYTNDEVSDRFLLPDRNAILAEISESEVENDMPIHESDVIGLVKDKLMLTKLVEAQANMIVSLLGELNEADKVACLAQKHQSTLEELLWDGLQYLGQLDLTIKDAREAKIEEYLTAGFKSSLRAANRDRSIKSARHKKDLLLHPKLDKMVKEESRSNTKVGAGCSVYLFNLLDNILDYEGA